jgi:hypothetical protein
MNSESILISAIMALTFILPQNAIAYIGPGAGITAIGTVIALISAVIIGILGFIWYPIKRLLSKSKNKKIKQKQT